MHNEVSHLFMYFITQILKVVKKKEKYRSQLVNYCATDTEKSKIYKISLKIMHFKICLYRTFNINKKENYFSKIAL